MEDSHWLDEVIKEHQKLSPSEMMPSNMVQGPNGWTTASGESVEGLEQAPLEKGINSLTAGMGMAAGIGGLANLAKGAMKAAPAVAKTAVEATQAAEGTPGYVLLNNMKQYVSPTLEGLTTSGKAPYNPAVSAEFGRETLMPWITKTLAPQSGASLAERKAAIETWHSLTNESSQHTGATILAKLLGN